MANPKVYSDIYVKTGVDPTTLEEFQKQFLYFLLNEYRMFFDEKSLKSFLPNPQQLNNFDINALNELQNNLQNTAIEYMLECSKNPMDKSQQNQFIQKYYHLSELLGNKKETSQHQSNLSQLDSIVNGLLGSIVKPSSAPAQNPTKSTILKSNKARMALKLDDGAGPSLN